MLHWWKNIIAKDLCDRMREFFNNSSEVVRESKNTMKILYRFCGSELVMKKPSFSFPWFLRLQKKKCEKLIKITSHGTDEKAPSCMLWHMSFFFFFFDQVCISIEHGKQSGNSLNIWQVIRHLSVDFRYILDLSLPNNSKSTTLELFLYLVIAKTLGTH